MSKKLIIIKKISVMLLTLVVATAFLFASTNHVSVNKGNIVSASNLTNKVWASSLAEIDSDKSQNSINNTIYIGMDSFIDLTDESVLDPTNILVSGKNNIILIASAMDLYYFTLACNSVAYKSLYLTYDYILGNDIDYNDAARYYKFVSPIGWGVESFTGTFDGMGFTISNLFYQPINSDDEYRSSYIEVRNNNEYSLQFYALFSVIGEGGVVKNIGLENVIILQPDIYGELYWAASLVGENHGTVSHVFVHDFRSDGAGLTCEGGFMAVSGLMVYNYGVFTSSYVAINKVISSSVNHQSSSNRFAILHVNGGFIEDIYYDSTILYDAVSNPRRIDALNNPIGDEDVVKGLNTSQFSSSEFFPYFKNSEYNGWYGTPTYLNYSVACSNSLNLVYPSLIGFPVGTDNNEKYFVITTASQLSYMTRLISLYGVFRNADYRLDNSIDMLSLADDAVYTSSTAFTGTLQSNKIDFTNGSDYYQLTFKDNSVSDYHSILNFKINKGTPYGGYRCYGFFEVFSGTIKNINFVDSIVSLDDLEGVSRYEDTNCIGVVCGRQEGGLIENVSVSGTIIVSNKTSNKVSDGTSNVLNNIARSYVGGIAGYSSLGNITMCTTIGVIDGSYQSITTGTAGITNSSIGGIVGKIEGTNNISNCLNSMNIYAMRFPTSTSTDALNQYVGGVIGHAAFSNVVEELENDGTITVGTDTNTADYCYGTIYVGGVIGLHENGSYEIGSFLNNSTINVYVKEIENTKIRVSGVINVHNEALAIDNPLRYSSLSSRSTMNIVNSTGITPGHIRNGVSQAYTYSSALDLIASGIIYTEKTNTVIEGAYNFDKRYLYQNGTKELVTLANQEIDLSIIYRYAPCVVSDNIVDSSLVTFTYPGNSQVNMIVKETDEGTYTNLSNSYNYRNIDYVTNYNVNFYNLVLSGNSVGLNFNLDNIRNDGNVVVNFTKTTQNTLLNAYYAENDYTADFKKAKVFGCFEEVSNNCKATNIYNGGNIEVTMAERINNSFNVVFNIYASGICYKNGNQKIFADENINVDDTIMRDDVDGTLHNAINNGTVMIHGNQSDTAYAYYGSGRYYGVTRASGITSVNASILSSCFNLADIININFITGVSGHGGYAGEFEVETGGICFLMLDQYAQIKDSANNGNIYSICTSRGNSWVNAGGIIVRNEKDEAGVDLGRGSVASSGACLNKIPHKQKIQYTINYGNVYAYNGYDDSWTSDEPRCKAAGFLCLGVNSVINVINYGNIYSSKICGGMYGLIFIQKFINNISTTSPVYIANALNYGNVYPIEVEANSMANLLNQTNDFNVSSDYPTIVTNGYPCGALIGYISSNGARSPSALFNRIFVSYLVNFVEDLNIIGRRSYLISDASTDEDDRVMKALIANMATTNPNDTSPAPFNDSSRGYGIKSYYKNTTAPNLSATDIYSQEYNGGIFNEEFPLRNPDNADQSVVTNKYISDYVQFIPFSKVNEYLVEKISLDTTIYNEAMQIFLLDLDAVTKGFNLVENSASVAQKIYESNPAIQSAVYANSDYYLLILEELYKNHPTAVSEFENVLKNIITNNQFITAYINDNHANDRFISLIDSIIKDTSVSSTVKDSIFSAMCLDLTYLAGLLEMYPTETEAIIDQYYADLSTNTEKQNELFEMITTNRDLMNSTDKYLDKDTLANLFVTLFSSTSISDEVVDYFYDYNPATKSYTLTGNALSTLFSSVLDLVDDTSVNSIKNSITLSDDGYSKIVSEYFLPDATYSNNDTLLRSIVDLTDATASLSKDEFVALWNQIVSECASKGIDLNTMLGDFYLKADSSLYIMDVSSTRGYAHLDSGNDTYTGPYRLTETSYVDNITNNSSFSTGRNTGETIFSIYYNEYPLGRFNWIEADNRFRDYLGDSQYATYYTDIKDYYVYYIRYVNINNQTFYTYNGHGEYFKFNISSSDGDLLYSFNDNINNISLENFKNFFNYVFVTKATEEVKQIAIKNLYLNTSMENGRVDSTYYYPIIDTLKNASLSNIDMREIITNIYNTNKDNTEISNLLLGNTIAASRSDKVYAISQVAYNDSSYYYDVFNDDAYGIELLVNSAGKTSFINRYYDHIRLRRAMLSISLSNTANIDSEEWIIMAMASNDDFINYVINTLLDNQQISYTNVLELISLLASYDSSVVSSSVSNYITLTDADKEYIGLIMAYYDGANTYYDTSYVSSNLFISLMVNQGYNLLSSNSSLKDEFIRFCSDVGVDYTNYTDYIGIYALASSGGIEQGEFLPDNVDLIKIDIYDGGVNDPTWRGGTLEDVNSFTNADGTYNTSCVNYKIYYMMKQLKKSIATSVFKIELTSEDGVYTVTNDVTACYDLKNRLITFYIASNADEAETTSYLVNTIRNFELSYEAIFKEGSIKEIVVPHEVNAGEVYTSMENDVKVYSFIIQAEDRTVETEYFIQIIITLDKKLEDVTSLSIGGSNVDYSESIYDIDLSSETYPSVGYQGGALNITYTTINIPNNEDLRNVINLYKYENGTLGDVVLEGAGYSYNNNTSNNARVTGSSYDTNNYSWSSGTLVIDLDISKFLPAGTYALQVRLTRNEIYLVIFNKAQSSDCLVETITYGEHVFVPNNVADNNDDPALIKFGTQHSYESLSLINSTTGIPNYLVEFVISPLATYEIQKVEVEEVDNIKTYRITYLITAEDKTSTSTFIHCLKEDAPINESLQTLYTDGSVSDSNPTGNLESFSNNTYNITFGKDKTPSYRFIYDLEKAYFSDTYVDFEVSEIVPVGTIIDRLTYDKLGSDASYYELLSNGLYQSNSSYSSAYSFTTLTSYLVVEYAGTDLTLAEQARYFSIEVEEGEGFTISFHELAEAGVYDFNVYYQSGSYLFDENDPTSLELKWNQSYTNVSITKDMNVRSYLENVTFITETMLTTINTLVSAEEINVDNYQTLLSNTDRPIVCLPSGIYYNMYDYSSDNMASHQNLFYVVGQVSKTNIQNYVPVFTLPADATIYRIQKFYSNTVEFVATEEIVDCNLNVYQVGSTVPVNTMLLEEVYSSLTNDKGYFTVEDLYRYTPYIYQENNYYQNRIFLVEENGTNIKDSAGTDIVVNGDADSFIYDGITYTLSNTAGTSGLDLLFERTAYVTSSGVEYFYVNRESNMVLDTALNHIAIDGSIDLFTYNSVSYLLSDTQDENREIITVSFSNFSLESDFNPDGLSFKYVLYRVYSEKYETIKTSDYYTDYLIAIQDITNNVRFDVTIKFDDAIDLATVDNSFIGFMELVNLRREDILGSSFASKLYHYRAVDGSDNRYFFVNDEGTVFIDKFGNDISSLVTATNHRSSITYNGVNYNCVDVYLLNNRMGMYTYYVTNNQILSHGTFTTNISGCYGLSLSMMEGYTFSYVITDPNDPDNPIYGEEDNYFFVIANALLSRTIDVQITIKEGTIDSDWGQRAEVDFVNNKG